MKSVVSGVRRWAVGVAAAAVATSVLAKDLAAVDLDPSRPAAAAAAELLTVSDARALQGLRKVALVAFNVEFVTGTSASAQAREIGRTGTAGMNVSYRLVGVGAQEMQAIANRLCDDFLKDLAGLGIEVLPDAALQSSAAWRKLTASGAPSPLMRDMQKTTSTVVAARGLPIYGLASQTSDGPLGALSAFKGAMSATFDTADLLTELALPLLSVDLRVNFAELQSNTTSLLGRISGSAEVKGKTALSVTRGELRVQRADGAAGAVALAQPLLMQGDAFVEVRDVSSVAGNVALAVLSLAIGNGGSQQVREKEAVVDPARFQEVVDVNLGAVRAMLTARLQSQQK